jgi:NAD(P)H-flavin reductase
MIKPHKRTIPLASVREETPGVRSFVFSEPSMHEPGQFVNIAFARNDELGRRSFSIASGPGEPLELTIKAVGAFTHALFDAPIGTVFEVHGPLGLPYVRFPEEPHLLIAGGSGIAPFRSLMHDERFVNTRFTLIDSNRTYEDIIYRDEITSWRANVIHTLTREEHSGCSFGRISRELLASIPNLLAHRVLICGPPGMVSTCIEHLISLGVAMNRIKTESWGN